MVRIEYNGCVRESTLGAGVDSKPADERSPARRPFSMYLSTRQGGKHVASRSQSSKDDYFKQTRRVYSYP